MGTIEKFWKEDKAPKVSEPKLTNTEWVKRCWTDKEILFRFKNGDPDTIIEALSALTFKPEWEIVELVESYGETVCDSAKKKAERKRKKELNKKPRGRCKKCA